MPTASDSARAWWRDLDRGGAARLRRCERPVDALIYPETLALIRVLGWWSDWKAERAAALAIVLAHVKEEDARPLMRALGRPVWGNERARLSEARFLSLMRIPDDDLATLSVELIRLLGLTDGAASIESLAEAIEWWTDQTRSNWARDYYAARLDNEENATEEGTANV